MKKMNENKGRKKNMDVRASIRTGQMLSQLNSISILYKQVSNSTDSFSCFATDKIL